MEAPLNATPPNERECVCAPPTCLLTYAEEEGLIEEQPVLMDPPVQVCVCVRVCACACVCVCMCLFLPRTLQIARTSSLHGVLPALLMYTTYIYKYITNLCIYIYHKLHALLMYTTYIYKYAHTFIYLYYIYKY